MVCIIIIVTSFILAAQAFNTCMGLSTLSTISYEEVAKSAPNVFLIMQLYVYKDREMSLNLIRTAEKSGYKAIALTTDAPILGQRIADVKHKFVLPDHLCLSNFKDVAKLRDVADNNSSGLMAYVSRNIEPKICAETVAWLKSVTKLPILLKGTLTAEDAREAVKMGVQGIIVSNHGGRQLDGVPSTVSFWFLTRYFENRVQTVIVQYSNQLSVTIHISISSVCGINLILETVKTMSVFQLTKQNLVP